MKEGQKKLEYIMIGAALVIGMAGSWRGHGILLANLHITKKNLASGHEKEGNVGS